MSQAVAALEALPFMRLVECRPPWSVFAHRKKDLRWLGESG
jgi:hypothetical protein